MTVPVFPPVPPKVIVVLESTRREINAVVKDGVPRNDFGYVHRVWMNETIAINENLPIILMLSSKFKELEFLIHHIELRPTPLGDNVKARSNLLRVALQQRICESAYFRAVIADIQGI